MVEKAKTSRAAFGRVLRAVAAGAALASVLSAQPASADWKADIGKLRIGMVAKPGAGATVPGVASLERAYSRALGLPVAIFVARDFAALIDAQAGGRVDYAVYSATAYAVASRFCACVEPVAAPVARDGATGVRAVLILRAGLPAGQATARVGIVPDGALPLALLSPLAAMAPEDGGRHYLGVPVAEVQEAERLFVAGELDGFLGWAPAREGAEAAPEGGSFDRLAARGVAAADVEIAWTSAAMRFGPHAVRADAPAELKDALRRFLVGLMESDPEIYDVLEEERQGGFVPVTAGDYAALEAMFDALAEDEAREP